jgi:hypothetical protein
MAREVTKLRNSLVSRFGHGSVPQDLWDAVDAIEAVVADRNSRIGELEDSVKAADDHADTEIAEDRREIAAELEPLFGAIFRGDMDDAKARVAFLPAALKGDDPILSAYWRAKARPTLFVPLPA